MRRLEAIAMTCAAMGVGISSGATPLLSNGLVGGDILTFDPHAQNEAFNNTANSYVYEALLNLNKEEKYSHALAEKLDFRPGRFCFQSCAKV